MSISILHLTDIHVGPGELTVEDNKVDIQGTNRIKQLERLSNYLEFISRPDFVVVSGDISIRGAAEGFEIFNEWLSKMIAANLLPPQNRILIAPGNHDVKRIKRHSDDKKPQFESFWNTFGTSYPHAHIPFFDPKLDAAKPKIKKVGDQIIGGLKCSSKSGKQILTESHPFILDLSRDLLIFAFNSSLACGQALAPDPKITEPLEAIKKINRNDDIKTTINDVNNAYLDSLIIDAGMIGII